MILKDYEIALIKEMIADEEWKIRVTGCSTKPRDLLKKITEIAMVEVTGAKAG